MEIGVFPRP